MKKKRAILYGVTHTILTASIILLWLVPTHQTVVAYVAKFLVAFCCAMLVAPHAVVACYLKAIAFWVLMGIDAFCLGLLLLYMIDYTFDGYSLFIFLLAQWFSLALVTLFTIDSHGGPA